MREREVDFLETSRYKAFVAAVECKSFSHAAERLNYTPSGVSQLVTALEKELGFPLLNRTKKGVELTKNGQQLLPIIKDIIVKEKHLYEMASEMNGLMTGSVSIAAFSSIATHWLPPVLKKFQAAYPNIEINLMEGIRQEVVGWLDDRVADIAFVSYRAPMEYDWIPLREDPMLAVIPPNHPYADKESFPMKLCTTERFIMPALGKDDDVVAMFKRHKIKPNVQFTTLENIASMALIEQGMGVSVMNELITKGWQVHVVKLPLDPPEHITMGIAAIEFKSLAPAVKKFVEYAVKELTEKEKKDEKSSKS